MSDVVRVSWFERDPGGSTSYVAPVLRIRLRRHTDGRVAVQVAPDGGWHILSPENRQFHTTVGTAPRTESGWSELLVAELPEPDGMDPDGRSVWTTDGGVNFISHVEAVSVGDEEPEERLDRSAAVLTSNALKILAAVAACEKYRTERDKE